MQQTRLDLAIAVTSMLNQLHHQFYSIFLACHAVEELLASYNVRDRVSFHAGVNIKPEVVQSESNDNEYFLCILCMILFCAYVVLQPVLQLVH